jgi:hypothetical protein
VTIGISDIDLDERRLDGSGSCPVLCLHSFFVAD